MNRTNEERAVEFMERIQTGVVDDFGEKEQQELRSLLNAPIMLDALRHIAWEQKQLGAEVLKMDLLSHTGEAVKSQGVIMGLARAIVILVELAFPEEEEENDG